MIFKFLSSISHRNQWGN